LFITAQKVIAHRPEIGQILSNKKMAKRA